MKAENITAYATVVLVVITAIYVGLTGWYASMTNKILKESEKMRRAAEQQATAAHQQAEVALATLGHMRERFADLHDSGKTIVRATIDSLVSSIDRWRKLDIKTNYVNAGTFPSPSDLLVPNAQDILEHGRVVSDRCVNLLNDAFNDLHSAHHQINVLIQSHDSSKVRPGFFDPSKYDPGPFLTSAFDKLQKARNEVEMTGQA